jgi:hypothetical protein
MRAVVLRSYGPPPQLGVEDISAPPLKAGQVRLRVHAVGFGFPDALTVAGKYQFKPEVPFTPGSEVAGVVTEVAAELPLQLIAELLGVPQEDRGKLFEWSNLMMSGEDPEFEGQSDIAAAEILGYAMGMAADRLANPREDLVTQLVHADKDGRGLTEDEFGYFVIALTVAGNETTRNAMAHGMNAFLDHPDQWELWKRERPSTMVSAFKTLQTNASQLLSEIKKSTRYSVSVVAIQTSNALLKLVKFIRFGK